MVLKETPKDMKKVKDIFDGIKGNLTQQEQDLINVLFGIEDRNPKTEEEFKKMYNLDNEQKRSVLRDVLTKCEKEVRQIQFAAHMYISDNIWIKAGDVVEIKMQVSEDPVETSDGPKIWHQITYELNGRELHDFSFDLPEDQKYDNICEYIDNSVCDDLEIEDYESFDATGDGFYETAKIKVLSIKG